MDGAILPDNTPPPPFAYPPANDFSPYENRPAFELADLIYRRNQMPPTRSTISCRYGPLRCLKSNHHHTLMSMIYTKQLMLLPLGRSHGSASQFHIMDQIRMMHRGRLQHMTSGSEILRLSFTASLLTWTLQMRWTLHQNGSKIIMGNAAIRILCQETGPGDKRYMIPISNSFASS